MKKQIMSLLLLFVFVIGLGTPAAAYEEEDCTNLKFIEAGDIDRFENMEIEAVGADVFRTFSATELETVTPENIDITQDIDASRARLPDLYLQEMVVIPFIYVEGETKFRPVSSAARYDIYGASSGYQQFGSIALTSAQLNDVRNDVVRFVSSQSDLQGKNVYFVGWTVAGLYEYASTRPLYFEYKGGENCINEPNPIRESVSASSHEYVVQRNFLIPEDGFNKYYLMDITGGFYFQENGSQGSAGVGLTLVVNRD